MKPEERKRAIRELNKEMKDISTLAAERIRTLDESIRELEKQGVKGVAKVLSTQGRYLSPAEVEFLKNATDEDIDKLIYSYKITKKLKTQMFCI